MKQVQVEFRNNNVNTTSNKSNNTVEVVKDETSVKTFRSIDLWKIQRQRKSIVIR